MAGHYAEIPPEPIKDLVHNAKQTDSVFEQMGGTLTGSATPQRTLLEKVHAACAFGAPAEATQEILSELTQVLRANESRHLPGVGWSPADLDRCEHGRHSIDSCFDCPRGKSVGNRFLVAPSQANPGQTRVTNEGLEVRIDTMVRGESIWVVAVASPRTEGVDSGN